MKTLFMAFSLLLLSSAFAAEKGGNETGELEMLLDQYKISKICPQVPREYCDGSSPVIDYSNSEVQEFLRDCCSEVTSAM